MALRALIVASGLRGIVGHNFAYTRAVEGALRQAGVDVTVLVHKHALPDITREPSFRPTFSHGIYDSAPGNGPWLDLRYLRAQSLIYALELRRAVEGQRFDLAFCHTVLDLELLGWNRFLASRAFHGHLLMLLRITPRFAEIPRWKLWLHPYWRIKPRTLNALRRKLGKRFVLLTDSDDLGKDYARVYRHRIVTAPIPLPSLALPRQGNWDGRSLRRLGWLGHAREGKGFALLPTLIRGVLAEENCTFEVQCATNEYDVEAPAALAELRELARAAPERVIISTNPLSDEQYFDLLGSLDLVILPYTDTYFREGTSNVFSEALALGRPVVVPEGTWMAHQLLRFGAGETYRPGDIHDLVGAIKRVFADYDRYETKARGTAPAWAHRHSPAALARVLLEECGLSPAAGSRR